MKIGFTGTQRGMTKKQLVAFRDLIAARSFDHGDDLEFHHGDCIGADAQAHDIVDTLGHHIVIHPPSDGSKRARCAGDDVTVLDPLPYLIRNKNIVDATTMLVATPGGIETLRSGTWSTVRYARKLGRRIHIIMPDGTCQGQL